MDYPKNLFENLEYRIWVNERAYTAKNYLSYRNALLRQCRDDILFYINMFVYQYNPNTIGDGSREVGPFITWDFQDEAFRVMEDCLSLKDPASRRDLVIEKSREMGASWMCLLLFDHPLLFHDQKKFLAISRSADAVDRPGDPDSLFWKLDFVHEHLPGWMQKMIHRRSMGFSNKATRSTLTGEASTGKAGVGGRAWGMFIDEFSQIDEDYEVLHRTSDTTKCRIFNFTHLGTDTAAYELTQRVDMRKLVLHWSEHPDKRKGLYSCDGVRVDVLDKQYHFDEAFKFVMDGSPTGGPHPGLRSPWYDGECVRKGSVRAIATDLDINACASVSQFFEPLTIRDLRAKTAKEPLWQGDIEFDSQSAELSRLVKQDQGPLKLWLQLDHKGEPPRSVYTFGIDCATGSGASNSCATGFDALIGCKVLEYVNPLIEPRELAALAVILCRMFKDEQNNPAKLIWEKAGPGATFGKHVIRHGFLNVYCKRNEEQTFVKEEFEVPGWQPTVNNKRGVLQSYKEALRTRDFVNPSELALAECLLFRYSGQKVEHAGELSVQDPSGANVNHGDRVIADALAWHLAKDVPKVRLGKIEKPPLLPTSLQWRRDYHARLDRERDAG